MRIDPVRTRADRNAFIDLPYRMYRDDAEFVPPLRMDVRKLINPRKSPFFEHGDMQLFLARDDREEVIGRIAAIRNGMHLRKYDDGAGFFGFFECPDDPGTARGLLEAAAGWLADQGLTEMRGPTNPSLNETAGLLVDGFESPPFVLMTHNPPYYEALLEGAGCERVMTLWAYYIHRRYARPEKLRRGVQLVHRRTPGLKLRRLDFKRFMDEARLIRDIYNEAWSDNWGHVPMTESEFDHLARDMKQVVDPDMANILELHGEPVGFAIAIPNINQALRDNRDGRLLPLGLPKLLARGWFGGINEVRLPLMGVRKKYHGRGFDAIMVLDIVERLPRMGFPACEMSWVLDSNHKLRNALDALGGIPYKEYALFSRPVAGGPAATDAPAGTDSDQVG